MLDIRQSSLNLKSMACDENGMKLEISNLKKIGEIYKYK